MSSRLLPTGTGLKLKEERNGSRALACAISGWEFHFVKHDIRNSIRSFEMRFFDRYIAFMKC